MPVSFFVKWVLAMSDFYYQRAVKLPPKEAVLFLFNHATGLAVNSFEVEISEPLGRDPEGRTVVEIRGLGVAGPNGDGGYSEKARFAYRRTSLTSLDIPSDGSFFDVIGSRPNFLDMVNEVIRLTQMTCFPEDFIQTEYRSDIEGGYVLRASPKSWRFEGEINLGHPRRANFDEFVPGNLDGLTFEDQDGIFDLKVDRIDINYDVTEYPDIIAKLSPGYRLAANDFVLFNMLLVQANYSGLTLVNSTEPNAFLNVRNMEVTYHGPLRSTSDDKHLFESRDRVIEFTLDPAFALNAFGTIKLYYASVGIPVPVMNGPSVYAMNMYSTPGSGVGYEMFWEQCAVGTILDDNGTAGVVSVCFEAAFGLIYDLIVNRALRVTYNGPARPSDFVPEGKETVRVCELMPVDNPHTHIYGPAKVYY